VCGIVGAVAPRDVVPGLLDALRRLEYRGYDSAGLAVLADTRIARVRRVGRVADLAAAAAGLAAPLGIGHTRWATHGAVTEDNAHPHVSGELIAVVHNGIVENHEALRAELSAQGYAFTSQTDTEVIAHLIHHHYVAERDLPAATRAAVARLEGAFAIGVLAADQPDVLCCARQGCPLLLGIVDGETCFASDVAALLAVTRRIVYLDDGDVATLARTGFAVTDVSGAPVERPVRETALSAQAAELGPYRHYMQKEIHEQPRALADTLAVAVEHGLDPALLGAGAPAALDGVDGVLILASGTSYHAGLVARYWIEALTGLPCTVEMGHEYRYRQSIPNPRALVVTLSQSGETLDTLEALKRAKALGHARTLSICNVAESAIPRASALVFHTRAGPEIGVASTKAFTTQLAALHLLTLILAKLRGRLDGRAEHAALDALRALPGSVQHALNLEPEIRPWARRFAPRHHALFLGRGVHYPIALEGALKLKEISYIHAEAYPAGELKHGPLALVDADMPVVVIAPNDALLEKLKSNMQEVRARGGELFVFADQDSRFEASPGVHVIRTPRHAGTLSPAVHAIPVQLLAYHAALERGTDVDKPRNLAKAVTVE
jgi:glutamine---fructose-6-phosphate transaminase (isomerizing)